MSVHRSGFGARAATAILSASLVAGCSTIPANGPTGPKIRSDARGPDNSIGYRIVDLTPQNVAAEGAAEPAVSKLAPLARDGAVDTVGPGDVLNIQIYEVGAGLFQGGRTAFGDLQDQTTPSANGSQLGNGVTVDRDGMISVPYVGRFRAAGLTPEEIQERILAGLKGKSQSPQVIVSLRSNVSNTVVVFGAVNRPGRYALTLARDHLLDAIAEAGGVQLAGAVSGSTASGGGAQDVRIRFTRGGVSATQPLDTIVAGSPDDLSLLPGDRIELLRQPRTFTVFGAIDRISQIPFESRVVSLIEAMARAGGPNDNRADPRAIFVFRLVPPPAPTGSNPVAPPPPPQTAIIYHLDMLKASSYFTAQQFAMHDKDVIYVGNATSNRPAKMIQLLSQLFTPVLTARAVIQ